MYTCNNTGMYDVRHAVSYGTIVYDWAARRACAHATPGAVPGVHVGTARGTVPGLVPEAGAAASVRQVGR